MEFLNQFSSFDSPGISMVANYFSTESWRLDSWIPGRGKCLINADLRDICDEPVYQVYLQSWSETDEQFWSEADWQWTLHQNEGITLLFSENDLRTPDLHA